jgi:hypothetical protein
VPPEIKLRNGSYETQFCCVEVDCAVCALCALCTGQVSDTRTVTAMSPIPILAAWAAPVIVPSEVDSFLEGFSITRNKFLSENAERVKMVQTFSKFSYPLLTIMYKFQL